MATPKRGEIWTADLGQSREWPVVILQSEAAEVVGTTIVIPLTEDMGKVGLRTLSSRRIRLRLFCSVSRPDVPA